MAKLIEPFRGNQKSEPLYPTSTGATALFKGSYTLYGKTEMRSLGWAHQNKLTSVTTQRCKFSSDTELFICSLPHIFAKRWLAKMVGTLTSGDGFDNEKWKLSGSEYEH